MATSTVLTNKPINPRGDDNRPVDSYNRASLYSGKALDFDGVNDYVDLAGLTFSGNNQSFCFYLKADAWNNFDYIFDIFSNRFIIGSQPANNLSIYDGASWQSFGEIDDTINTNFFVVTIEGTTSKAYLNGVQFGSNLTIALRDFTAANECALMSQYDGVQQFFPGKMSGFKAFEVALTAAQVADLYNNPEKVVPTGVSNTALKLWLPMMEGAGTTAYDGSGNGNHGTISGATYVHGIGAPVAQTAVIDWNKGVNLLAYSEALNTSNYFNGLRILFEANKSAPNGSADAMRLKLSATVTNTIAYIIRGGISGYAGQTISAFLKADEITEVLLFSNGGAGIYFNIEDGSFISYFQTSANIDSYNIEDFGGGWRRYSITFNTAVNDIQILFAKNGDITADYTINEGLEIFGVCVGSVNYTPTSAYPGQTSPVLLPQGLTSGRDITGVNLFENVRKQGALNLDGNSWAEVHDNESLDFGTGSFTLEAWVKAKYINQGSVFNMIISLGGNITSSNNAGLMLLNNNVPYFIYSNPGASSGSAQTEGDWIHIVGTYDETNTTIYVNGVQVDQDARTASDITNGFAKVIGRDGTDPNRFYQDQIAQPRIYNRALTASEVLNNYNATSSLYI